MALTKVNGDGVGTLSSGLTLTSDDPTITMTDSSGTNDIVTLQATSGALIVTARDGSADGEIIFKKTDGSATDESMRIDNTGSLRLGTTGTEGITNKLTIKFNGAGTQYGIVMRPVNSGNTVAQYFMMHSLQLQQGARAARARDLH